mmetsp:Transcript_41081/g.132115  ORF Transcript_41081/g.132115 Transcript_41081/m.132115 type:complete len:242 (+) Transcript_41081:147-872(+)
MGNEIQQSQDMPGMNGCLLVGDMVLATHRQSLHEERQISRCRPAKRPRRHLELLRRDPLAQALGLQRDGGHIGVALADGLIVRGGVVDPVVAPQPDVFCHLRGQRVKLGEDLDRRHGEGCHEEVDEAVLGARPADLLAVVEHAHGDAQALLLVALVEELVEDTMRPSLADVERLQWIRDVGKVEEELQEQRGVLAQDVRLVLRQERRSRRQAGLFLDDVGANLVGLVHILHHVEVVREISV